MRSSKVKSATDVTANIHASLADLEMLPSTRFKYQEVGHISKACRKAAGKLGKGKVQNLEGNCVYGRERQDSEDQPGIFGLCATRTGDANKG